MSIFDIEVNRCSTNSCKWDKGALENISSNPNSLPFWVADMDFVPEPHIKQKAEEIAELGIFGYPMFPKFNQIVSSWLKKKHSWIVDENDITFTMGLLHGIGLALDVFTKEKDKILVPSPTYRPFRELCSRGDREFVDLPLGYKDSRFFFDRNSFIEKAMSVKVILFCSPHNPSGLVFNEDDLDFVLNFAKEKNILVFSDEIHADLVHPGKKHIPIGKANEKIGAKTITFMAPSKTFNVAGEHSGIAIFSSKEMKEKFQKKQRALWLTEPGYVIGELTETAYLEGLEYNIELTEYLKGNADFIRTYLKENIPDIELTNAEASFVAFLDCSKLYSKIEKEVKKNPEKYKGGSGGGILSRFFGIEGNVAFNDGTWFGDEYKNFIRFNFGTNRAMVKKGLDGIKEAVSKLD